MKTLLITAACLAVLLPCTTVLAGNILQTKQNQIVLQSGSDRVLLETPKTLMVSGNYQTIRQQQYSRVSLSAAKLKQPHILSIHTTGAQLTGKITVNGVVVKTLKNSKDSINLSPYLAKGKRTIEISARSVPAFNAIQVKFSGPGTQITQQVKGGGTLQQMFVMDIY